MQFAELALALKSPIFQAEFMIETKEPLNFYSSFIPRLKQLMVSKPAYEHKHYID